MGDYFAKDRHDRKRRFLRGLNRLLEVGWGNIQDKDILLWDAVNSREGIGIVGFRNALAETYCLEFTPDELGKLIAGGMTSGEFTQKYVAVIYKSRGRADLNTVIGSSMVNCGGKPAISLAEMDKAPKYGLNGSEWCDVATGPCSCGAWH